MPRASVIIPYAKTCPEAPKRLETALSCLEKQVFRDFEVIVEPGEDGVSKARNRALGRAKGEFIAFMDADDECDGYFLSDLVAAAEKHNADFVLAAFWMRENEGAPFYPRLPRENYTTIDQYLPRIAGYSIADIHRWNAGGKLFDTRELAGVWRSLYRRDLIERNHIRFDESLRLYEDAVFTTRYCLHARSIAIAPVPHYRYTLRPTGAVGRLEKSVEARLALIEARRRLGREELYLGSLALEVLSFLRGGHFRAALRLARQPDARRAIAAFPFSWRHPLAAALRIV